MLKTDFYAKDLNEPRYQFLIKDWNCGWRCWNKTFNDPKVFIEYSECMDDVYNNIND